MWPIYRWSLLWASNLKQWNVHPYGRSTNGHFYGQVTLNSEMCFIRVADRPMVPFMGNQQSNVFHPCDRPTEGLFSIQALSVLFDGLVDHTMSMDRWAIKYNYISKWLTIKICMDTTSDWNRNIYIYFLIICYSLNTQIRKRNCRINE